MTEEEEKKKSVWIKEMYHKVLRLRAAEKGTSIELELEDILKKEIVV